MKQIQFSLEPFVPDRLAGILAVSVQKAEFGASFISPRVRCQQSYLNVFATNFK